MKTAMLAACAVFCFNSSHAATLPHDYSVAKKTEQAKHVKTSQSKASLPPGMPDFAFPAEVARQSRDGIRSCDAAKNPIKALRAAINLSVADNEISGEKAIADIAVIDSLSQRMANPWSALAMLLEARLYADIYNAEPWTYNSRTLPADFHDPNPTLWSRNLFVARIDSLVRNAISNSTGSKDIPVSRAREIIQLSDTTCQGLTLYDFIVYQSVSLLDRFHPADRAEIPFFKPAASLLSSTEVFTGHLLDSLEEMHRPAKDAPFVMAVIAKAGRIHDSEEKIRYIDNSLDYLSDSPASLMLIAYIYNRGIYRTPAFLSSMKDALARFPDAPGAEAVRNAIADISTPSLHLNTPGTVIPGVPFTATVTAENASEYYVHIYRLRGDEQRSLKVSLLPQIGKAIRTIHRQTPDSIIPFNCTDTLQLSLPDPGFYAVAISLTPSLTSAGSSYAAKINASDITMTLLSDNRNGKTALYVRDAMTGKPQSGAKVSFKESRYKSPKTSSTTTDRDGYASSPYLNAEATASLRGSRVSSYAGAWRSEASKTLDAARLLTDAAIYHPGDSVRFVAICYTVDAPDATSGRIAPGLSKEYILTNASGQPVDTLRLTSDNSGRATGAFRIPEEGMTGRWFISIPSLQGVGFEVADYKAPPFMLNITQKESSDSTVVFEGYAATYSGMPLGEIPVKYTVDFSPWWFRASGAAPASYSANTTTDAEGKFHISLPLDNIADTPYRFGVYSLSATAVDKAGVTVSATPIRFMLSKSYYLTPSIPSSTEVLSDSLTFKVSAYDPLGFPARRTVEYSVVNAAGDSVLSGSFVAPILTLPASGLPSGEYEFRFRLADESGSADDCGDTNARTVIWRADDRRPPVATPLWVPRTLITARPGSRDTKVTIGSTRPGHDILCVVSGPEGEIERRWIKASDGNFTISLPSPSGNGRIWADLSAIDSLKVFSSRVTIQPAEALDRLEITTESFRESITPGTGELWRFRLNMAGKPAPGAPFLAVMTNRALDSFTPFDWNFSLPLSSPECLTYIRSLNIGSSYASMTRRISGSTSVSPLEMEWQTWGYPLYGTAFRSRQFATRAYKQAATKAADMAESADAGNGLGSITVRGSSFNSAAITEEAAVETEGVASDADSAPAENGNPETDGITLRPSEMPIAFFQPTLTTDEEGIANVEFRVPDFNTEWKLQLGAYTEDLHTAAMTLYARSARPVMTSMNVPRFLQTDDRCTLSATSYNNTDSALSITTLIEVFDPLTGDIIASHRELADSILPSANTQAAVSLRIPSDIQLLGVRVYAISSGGKDGEQTIIPILPSSQPVTESVDFTIPQGVESFTISIPEKLKQGRATLQYASNPVWSVLTALPPIASTDSKSATAILRTLFANCTGSGLIGRYPDLREGLRMIADGEAGDSLLISNLQKEPDLKIVSIANTPWVNSASSETLRLASLSTLLDDTAALHTSEALWKSLLTLQNADGGWSWCPEMKSSQFVTQKVILNTGLLSESGFLPDFQRFGKSISKAIAYCDGEIVNDYKEALKSRTRFDYIGQLDYIYARGFHSRKCNGVFAEINKGVMTAIQSDWRRLDILHKAMAATILMREGNRKDAETIIRSIREFASSSPQKGMWFDNSRHTGASPLLTTATVLQTLAMANPADSDIDLLRQWLLLQRQTQSWQQGDDALRAITALLTTGTRWTTPGKSHVGIKIGNEYVMPDSLARMTGNINIDLDTERFAGKEVTITRSPDCGPAWGGIISQYVAPIADIRPASVSDLKIEKRYYLVEQTQAGEKATEAKSFAVGDKVRVTLILSVGKDMDFVVINDRRTPAFEPADQLSGYASSDGTWFYREVRNDATNLYFDSLAAGKYVLSYDGYISASGQFAAGIATVQCEYAPLQTAHSRGTVITVN